MKCGGEEERTRPRCQFYCVRQPPPAASTFLGRHDDPFESLWIRRMTSVRRTFPSRIRPIQMSLDNLPSTPCAQLLSCLQSFEPLSRQCQSEAVFRFPDREAKGDLSSCAGSSVWPTTRQLVPTGLASKAASDMIMRLFRLCPSAYRSPSPRRI